MKKKLIVLGSVAMMAIATVFALNSMSDESFSSLEAKNIEALSAGETITSWNCNAPGSRCYANCSSCGTTVGTGSGRGGLSGSHSCR